MAGQGRKLQGAASGLACLWLLAPAMHLLGADFTPSPARAEWRLAASAGECRLAQPIAHLGEAVFWQRAGDTLRFRLQGERRMRAGSARLSVRAPSWRAAIEPRELGAVPVDPGPLAIEVDPVRAGQMLEALHQGLSPVFEDLPAGTAGERSSVGLLSVNFRRAYSDYRDCTGALPAVAFADIQRTRIPYAPGQIDPGPDARARLDVLARHIVGEAGVSAVYVDGHTDDTGTDAANLETSRRRAQAVSDYLVARGVPSALLTTRFHGSRYPAVRGKSAAARAQNRRVTVRLER